VNLKGTTALSCRRSELKGLTIAEVHRRARMVGPGPGDAKDGHGRLLLAGTQIRVILGAGAD